MYILSQVLVVISDILCIISMLTKNKKSVVFYLIFSTILFGSHFLCLAEYTGAVLALVELIFLILMYILEIKDKLQYTTILSLVTIVVSIILSILTWDTWVSVLSMMAMIIYLVTMMFKNLVVVKSGVFVRITLNAIYMFLIRSYLGAGLSIVILIFTILGVVQDIKANRSEEKNNV